jgi:hypothetical protein
MNTASLLALILGTIIPAATALIAKQHASPKIKALLNAMLSAIAGGLSGAFLAPPHGIAQWEQIVYTVLLAWISAGAAYITGYVPTGAAAAISKATANFGIGPSTPPVAQQAA